MTGWPDALIEDYLNIIDNTVLLATTIDGDIDTLNEVIAAINNLLQHVETFQGQITQNANGIRNARAKSNDIEQLIYTRG